MTSHKPVRSMGTPPTSSEMLPTVTKKPGDLKIEQIFQKKILKEIDFLHILHQPSLLDKIIKILKKIDVLHLFHTHKKDITVEQMQKFKDAVTIFNDWSLPTSFTKIAVDSQKKEIFVDKAKQLENLFPKTAAERMSFVELLTKSINQIIPDDALDADENSNVCELLLLASNNLKLFSQDFLNELLNDYDKITDLIKSMQYGRVYNDLIDLKEKIIIFKIITKKERLLQEYREVVHKTFPTNLLDDRNFKQQVQALENTIKKRSSEKRESITKIHDSLITCAEEKKGSPLTKQETKSLFRLLFLAQSNPRGHNLDFLGAPSPTDQAYAQKYQAFKDAIEFYQKAF